MQDTQGIFLIVALAGAIISGALASSKGRSGLGWAIFGFFMPLIAVIAALCMQPKASLDEPWQP
ncbi:MAG: hypothetical protein JO257_08490 [Deltaproteobacteria bacterium]|nr:hypothetical protein [Deltaproteobacteria bacterium]